MNLAFAQHLLDWASVVQLAGAMQFHGGGQIVTAGAQCLAQREPVLRPHEQKSRRNTQCGGEAIERVEVRIGGTFAAL
ncbi:hypothetical protein T266_28625 [Pseudomonas aeruginosa VRFPA05]|nr:hypothetical protein T266_28625 [Pseudomonas aeruginosa VRFPA05]